GIAGFIALRAENSIKVRDTALWSILFALPVIALLLCARLRHRRSKYAYHILIGGFALFNILVLGFAYPGVYRHNPVTTHLGLIRSASKLGSFGLYNPAVNFYIDEDITPLNDSAAIIQFLQQYPDALLVGRKKDTDTLEGLPVRIIAEQKDLFENPTTVFL